MGKSENYSENMEKIKEGLSNSNQKLWMSSLYANWLNTLRPLLEEKGEGYPFFMQNAEWTKKNLECFSGSFVHFDCYIDGRRISCCNFQYLPIWVCGNIHYNGSRKFLGSFYSCIFFYGQLEHQIYNAARRNISLKQK